MEMIECKGEAKFNSVTGVNHKHEDKTLELDEQGG